MTYNIICRTYRASVLAAKDFANHYSTTGAEFKMNLREPVVKAGEHTFIFLNSNSQVKGRKGEFITIDEFVKKYYDTSTPKIQTV